MGVALEAGQGTRPLTQHRRCPLGRACLTGASAAHHCHFSATHTHFSGDVFQGPDRRAVTGTLPGNLAWGRSVSSMGLPLSFTGWFSGRGLALDLGTQVSPEGISSWMARCTPCVCVRVRGMR